MCVPVHVLHIRVVAVQTHGWFSSALSGIGGERLDKRCFCRMVKAAHDINIGGGPVMGYGVSEWTTLPRGGAERDGGL